ncbi:MAG: hypothetical protein ACI4JJ_07415 [Huintestinicola sp.]
MQTRSLLKKLINVKGHYAESVKLLAKEGYSDGYMTLLKEEISSAKKKKDAAEGQAFLAQAHLFRGELDSAEKAFAAADYAHLPDHISSVFFNNYIVCLFLMGGEGHMKEISRIYKEHNKTVLAENTLVMRRTIGINEFIEKRYENAVTVFVKLLSEPDPRTTLFADICLTKSLLALDMFDRAKEISDAGFGRYKGMGDIYEETKRIKTKISAGLLTSSAPAKKRKNRK